MLLSQPEANLVVPRKPVWGVAFDLQRRQGRVRHASMHGWRRDTGAQGLLQTTLGVGVKPCSHTMAMGPNQGGDGLPVTCVAAHSELQRLQPLAFLEVFLTFHAVL